MRLFDLFEESQVLNEVDIAEFFKAVEHRCSDIVNLYKQNPGSYFYRGSLNPYKDRLIWGEQTRTDRKPSNTTPELQAAIDILMRGQGLQAVRSNSIFVTPTLLTAKGYSTMDSPVYIIFPVNGFKYSWSPYVRDFYVKGFRSTKSDTLTMGGEQAPTADELLDAALHQEFQWFKRRYKYTDSDLQSALGIGNEVLIAGQYYAFSIGVDNNEEAHWIDFVNGILHR